MATSNLARQLAALEAVRAELEAALGSDENWRALRRVGPAGGHGDPDPDRRDRDARLTKALEANPLYGAWRQLGEAVRALRDGERVAKAAETRDDLTRIRGVSPSVARRLVENGVTRYAKIAAWSAEDVSIATEVLALPPGGIDRQSWIQQATLLAARKSEVSAEPAPGSLPESESEPEAVEPALDLADDLADDLASELDGDSPPEPEADMEGSADAPPETVGPAGDALQESREQPAETRVVEAAATRVYPAELPEDIRELIRTNAADAETLEPEPMTRPSLPPHIEAESAATAATAEPSAKRKLGGKLAAIPSVEPISAPAHLEFAERLQRLEADMDEFDEAIDAPAPRPGDDIGVPARAPAAPAGGVERRMNPAGDLPSVRMMAEPAEAKVTFVTRDPQPTAPPGEPPAALAPERDQEVAAAAETFALPAGALEEAEVTIVKPGSAESGPVKRFLKALSGN